MAAEDDHQIGYQALPRGVPVHASDGARVAYVILFGLGSTLSMAALTGVMGWPLARLGHHALIGRTISLAVGAVSTVIGLAWGIAAWGQF